MARIDSGRPAAGEYIAYYEPYIGRVPEGDITEILERQLTDTLAFTASIAPELARQRATPEGWNALQVLGHMADGERIFTYRALRFARGDATPLPSVDLDAYVTAGGFDQRSLAEVVDEFASVRRATVTLLRGLEAASWTRSGLADGQRISVRALAYVLAGHEAQHIEELRSAGAGGG